MSSSKKSINLPTLLTWARIAFIPLIVGVFYLPESVMAAQTQNTLACIMFVLAAITDALDGYIARHWNMVTKMGAFLDTVADKLVVCAAIVVLLEFDRVPMIVALIIVGREIAITALREWMAKIGAADTVKVNWFGKIKAIAQMVAIPMLLYKQEFLGIDIMWLGTVLIWIAAALTVYSMFVYMAAAWPVIEKSDEQ